MVRGCRPGHEDESVVQTHLLVARARKPAPKPKRTGRCLPGSPLLVSANRRGGKGMPRLKRRKPASGKEGSPPFLARRMLSCPGMGPFAHRELFLSAEPDENTSFSEGTPFFFSTNWEMTLVFYNNLCVFSEARSFYRRIRTGDSGLKRSIAFGPGK